MKIEKIVDAIKRGEFLWKAKRTVYNKVLSNKKIFKVENKNTKQQLLQDMAYKKLKREYGRFIEEYSPVFTEHEFEKKIWICWLQGYDEAPAFVKACINSIRSQAEGFEVVILTESNIDEYVKLPEHIIRKYQQGKISRTHFSDILRISILCERGGIWADSTVLCTDGTFFDSLLKYPLFVFKVLDLTRQDTNSIVASSWFISSFANSSILNLTRDLLYKYWEKHDYLVNYFVFHVFFTLATQKYPEEWEKIPMFENLAPHVLMFELEKDYSEERWKQITAMSDIHKLTRHISYENLEKSFYCYILSRYGKISRKGIGAE